RSLRQSSAQQQRQAQRERHTQQRGARVAARPQPARPPPQPTMEFVGSMTDGNIAFDQQLESPGAGAAEGQHKRRRAGAAAPLHPLQHPPRDCTPSPTPGLAPPAMDEGDEDEEQQRAAAASDAAAGGSRAGAAGEGGAAARGGLRRPGLENKVELTASAQQAVDQIDELVLEIDGDMVHLENDVMAFLDNLKATWRRRIAQVRGEINGFHMGTTTELARVSDLVQDATQRRNMMLRATEQLSATVGQLGGGGGF
ncbi:MAG: hypothetical protein J3K34DRAFT_492978, partial [Monoraphidium minutum]